MPKTEFLGAHFNTGAIGLDAQEFRGDYGGYDDGEGYGTGAAEGRTGGLAGLMGLASAPLYPMETSWGLQALVRR